jgi:porin
LKAGNPSPRRTLTAGALLLTALVLPATAQIPTAEGNNDGAALSESADEIGAQISELDETRQTRLYGPFSPVFNAWDSWWTTVNDSVGLSMGFAYTALGQAATNGTYTGPRDGTSGDFDIFGRWYAFNRNNNKGILGEGILGFNAEYRHQIGSQTTPAEIGDNIGSLWGTTTGFNEQDFNIIELWWQQRLFDDHLALRIGKIDLANLIDVYRFNSANHFYQNAAFSDNPAIPFPENGLAIVVEWSPSDNLFARFAIADAEGRKTETLRSGINNIDAWFTATTIGWNPQVGDLGRGLYQVTLWHSEERKRSERPSGNGFSIVAQQELPNNWVPYIRYARSTSDVVDTRQILTAGAVLEKPFDRKYDRFGLAAGWDQPHDPSLRNQWVSEAFYRWAITPEVRLTPFAQILVNPSRNPDDKTIAVFGLRTRITF